MGIDLTDRYAKRPRPNDVCILHGTQGNLKVRFETWEWSRTSLNEQAVLNYARSARAVFIDGPQGLAAPGRTMRESERALGTPGKTPPELPTLARPFAGFIQSSVELFEAIRAAGVEVGPVALAGVHEVYPGAIWKHFHKRLAKKGTKAGRHQRDVILDILGVVEPSERMDDDQRDAAVAAVLAAAVDGLVKGVGVVAAGDPVWWDDKGACLREGWILVPVVSERLAQRIEREVVAAIEVPVSTGSALIDALVSRAARVAVGASVVRKSPAGTVRSGRAYLRSVLLEHFSTDDADEFVTVLDKETKQLQRALPKGARNWGLARKVLNIFVRDAVCNAHLRREFKLDRCEHLCELPLDSVVIGCLGDEVGRETLPKWTGVNDLKPAANAKFQEAARLAAKARGVDRLHLDSFWWSQSRDTE